MIVLRKRNTDAILTFLTYAESVAVFCPSDCDDVKTLFFEWHDMWVTWSVIWCRTHSELMTSFVWSVAPAPVMSRIRVRWLDLLWLTRSLIGSIYTDSMANRIWKNKKCVNRSFLTSLGLCNASSMCSTSADVCLRTNHTATQLPLGYTCVSHGIRCVAYR